MSANVGQHRYFHGILLAKFLEHLGLEVTKDHILVVKTMLKKHLKVKSVASLPDHDYYELTQEVEAILASEWGFELPDNEAKDMSQILKETNDKYDDLQ